MRVLRQWCCCFTLCCCSSAAGAEPLPVRDLNPLLSGYELPAALPTIPSSTTLSAEFAIANVSLAQSAAQEALQLDAELQRWQLSFTKPLGDTFGLRIELPYLSVSGGQLDSFIESFHDTFGLPNGNRDLWPRDRLWIQHKYEGQLDYGLSEVQHGIGDLTLRLGTRMGADPDFTNTLWFSLKLPTGNTDKLAGSGSTDVALSLATSQQLGTRFASQQQISLSMLGQGKRSVSQQETRVWSGSLGLDAMLASHWNVAVQLDGHTRVFDSKLRALGSALQLSFGSRYHSRAWTSTLLISEDIAVDTAPDVQLQLFVTHGF